MFSKDKPLFVLPRLETRLVFGQEKYGGILCDIGSHQIEQFLVYTGAVDAVVVSARAENVDHPETPELEDFGEASLVGDNGASGYFRVDWTTPNRSGSNGRRSQGSRISVKNGDLT